MNRKTRNWIRFWGTAQPTAEMRKSTAETIMKRRRPSRSLMAPAAPAPIMQPTRTMLTARPSPKADRAKRSLRKRMAPAMMAVSNPNKSPPRAATTET